MLTKNKIDVIDFLRIRRSTVAKKMLVGRVLRKDLKTILEIGTRVPDHGSLKPWRIKIIEGKTRKYLDEVVILKEFKKKIKVPQTKQ